MTMCVLFTRVLCVWAGIRQQMQTISNSQRHVVAKYTTRINLESELVFVMLYLGSGRDNKCSCGASFEMEMKL